jgi:RHS repeat-associated protein
LPTATVDYQYDKNHQLKKLSQSGLGVIAQVMEFGYDRLNQLTNISRTTANSAGALATDYQYNEVGLLKDINNYFIKPTAFNLITTISNYHYDYDAGNRLTTKSGTDGNSVIDYGKDNQLKSVDNSNRTDEAYNFNALGIRNNWSTVTSDSRQILNDGKFEYKYDNEGNLTRKEELATRKITTYEWDYRNRLSKVISVGQQVQYQYDAEDRRVGKAINGVTQEKYIYDGQDIALVVNSAGTITERYLYGAGVDNVLSREANDQVTWSLGDRQGSIVNLVNEQGAVVNHFVYDSFGNRTGSTTADFRFGYTGRELDTETGLYYYRARYYDPAVGRFVSEDPIGFSAGDTNLYRYVGNNATNYTDPSGKILFLPLLVVLGGGFLAGAGINTVKQGLEIAEGSRKEFSTDEVFTSGAFGAIAAPIFILAPELAVPFAIKGFAEGAYNMTHGKPLSGAFDIATSVLPFSSSKVRSQSFGKGTIFGKIAGLGEITSKSDRLARLTNIEAFDNFHGITAEYQVSIFGLARGKTRTQIIEELPQATFGHVGFSFNSGKKIYGFNPKIVGMTAESAKDSLIARQQFPGILTNDTAMFSKAKILGLNIIEQKHQVGLLRHTTAKIQSTMQEEFGMMPSQIKYMLPPKGSDANGNPIAFPGNCYNCDTYPNRVLNLPNFSSSGRLNDNLPK